MGKHINLRRLNMKKHIKIKEFSELTGLSVRTLQYYDDIQLLKPSFKNKFGHRFYDASSFSMIFVIQSLKDLGMNLEDIKKYLSREDFNIQQFVDEEIRRTKDKIAMLQVKLLHLEEIENSDQLTDNMHPYMLPLLSKGLKNIPNIENTEHLNLDFNLEEWQDFLDKLTYCRQNNLDISHPYARICIQYWQDNILKKNQELSLRDITPIAENHYQNENKHRFGMTSENYQYLNQLLKKSINFYHNLS